MVYKPSQMWTNLAQIQVIFDERDEALRVMLEASQINPQFWEVWRDLAAMSLSCHKFDIFIKSYSRHSIDDFNFFLEFIFSLLVFN